MGGLVQGANVQGFVVWIGAAGTHMCPCKVFVDSPQLNSISA